MRIKITKGGNFAHPNPKYAGRPHLRLDTGKEYDVDDEQGARIIQNGRAELVASEREFEVRKAEVVEEPPAAEVEEVIEEPKKRRGRPPGQKKAI